VWGNAADLRGGRGLSEKTHDDITYPALAAAFDSPLELHEETAARMRRMSHARPNAAPFDWDTPSATLTARMRMAMLPSGPKTKVIYVADDQWVPVSVVNYNVHILPGVPGLFVQLLEGLKAVLLGDKRLDHERKATRVLISTPLMESDIAEFLTTLQERVAVKGVKIGSYPRWGLRRNTVTLVGTDKEFVESLVEEVERETAGKRVLDEAELDEPGKLEAMEVKGNQISHPIPEQTGLADGVKNLKIGE